MKTMVQKTGRTILAILHIAFLMVLVVSCRGGGIADYTGEWAGLCKCGNEIHVIAFKIIQNSSEVSGTFQTSQTTSGDISGLVSGKTLHFKLIDHNCLGRYSGTAILDADKINLSYSGSDLCSAGIVSGTGDIYRQPHCASQSYFHSEADTALF
jgi:hypothetical protein